MPGCSAKPASRVPSAKWSRPPSGLPPQRAVAQQVQFPPGSYLEWSGQFEHQVRARRTLSLVFPAVILLIFLILYMTYNDMADAVLMMMAVPGALAGGVLFQALFGYNFSVAVWVGYIACFGMATETAQGDARFDPGLDVHRVGPADAGIQRQRVLQSAGERQLVGLGLFALGQDVFLCHGFWEK